MAKVLTSLPVLGDLLKMELDHRYNRVGAFPAEDDEGADGEVPESLLGYPVSLATVEGKNEFTLLVAADIADLDGIILDQKRKGPDLADMETLGLPVLVRGPALINRNMLPTVDYAGAAINLDNFTAALAALGIHFLDEHPETTVHPL